MYEQLKHMIAPNDRMIIGYERMSVFYEKSAADPFTYCFDTMRVGHVLTGSFQWKIGDRLYDVHAGDVVILSNTEYRRIFPLENSGETSMDVFAFRPEAVQFDEECLRVFLGRTPSFENILPSTPRLDEIFHAIVREITASKRSLTLLRALLTCLCIELTRQIEARSPDMLGQPDAVHIKNALAITSAAAYIQNHLDENLSLDELARHANMSVSYFTRLFRQHLGVSAHDFLVRRRVEQVTQLLQTTDMDVLEAAFQCGFQSSSGFYRAYRAITGTAPISYARNSAR